MLTSTTYNKCVAQTVINGTTYYAHGSMAAADGSPYLTTDIAEAKDYTGCQRYPVGHILRRIRQTVSRECLGGGFITVCGPSGP